MKLPRGVRFFPKPQLETVLRDFLSDLGVPENEWADRGLDIANTPHRVAKMYRDELLASYKPSALRQLVEHFTCFDAADDDSMVTEGPFDVSSLCAHHMLQFTGDAYVGYLPGDRLIGASKLCRVVTYYSKMLQIQERMTRQIAEFILEHSRAKAVVVLIKAKHACMVCRGVKQTRAHMVTTAVRPLSILADRGIVDEFYKQIQILTS